MIKGFLGLFLLTLISGCASKPITQYVDRPVEVFVSVPKACLAKGEVPDAPILHVDLLGDTATLEDAIRAARADRLLARSYVLYSQKLLKLCAD